MKIFLLGLLLAIISLESTNAVQTVTIYSGMCTNYKRTHAGGTKVRYTPVKQAYGKVVINRTSKKFSFYFDGKLICSRDQYLSDIDQQGGEGFSLDNGYSAQRLIAEKTFLIFYSPGMGDFGNEYEITNYKVN